MQRQFAHIPGDARLVLLRNFNQIQIVRDAELLGWQRKTYPGFDVENGGSTTKNMYIYIYMSSIGFYSEHDDQIEINW